jgi:hypothetical protein
MILYLDTNVILARYSRGEHAYDASKRLITIRSPRKPTSLDVGGIGGN